MMFLIEEHDFRENHQEVSNLKDEKNEIHRFVSSPETHPLLSVRTI